MLTLGEFYIRLEAYESDNDPSLPPLQTSYIAKPMRLADIRLRVGEPDKICPEGRKVILHYRVSDNGVDEMPVRVEGTAGDGDFLTNVRILPPPAGTHWYRHEGHRES